MTNDSALPPLIEEDRALPYEEGALGRHESPMPRGRATLALDPDLPPPPRALSRSLFSSARGDWCTPSDLLIPVLKEFPIGIDLAATAENAITPRFLGPGSPLAEDALTGPTWETWGVEWGWLNPPYGLGVGAWVSKAFDSSRAGMGIVMLLPARTDTRWFHDLVLPYAEIRFLRGRVKFVGAPASAPFPSMLLVFRPPSPWVGMRLVSIGG